MKNFNENREDKVTKDDNESNKTNEAWIKQREKDHRILPYSLN